MSGAKVKAPRKGFSEWTVVGEPSLDRVGHRLWLIKGYVPGMQLGRWMAVARREDGSLVIHNPVALPEAEMSCIDEWGPVGVIVVPNRFHRLDAAPFHQRYPKAKVVCPAGARAKVEEVVPVDLVYGELEADAVVSLRHVAGLDDSEGVMTVHDEDGTTLVLNDLLFNMEHGKGLAGLVFRVLGSTGGPRVTRLFKMLALKDKTALREALRSLADTEDLVRVVPGHGRIIDEDPAGTLRAVAERL
ncbi:MAG: hypothetical protein H6712_27470 [Myxococcales bacterium]|nr:hypothetical protein [Myxococcales bacterium]MCB9717618.1 hypothetical protein [Myxococcales bacterium]